jgi:hypothetical protein
MNDEAFSRLVAEEVKNKASEAQKKYLAMPENIDRWKRALQYLSTNLEEQIKEIDRQEKIRLTQYKSLGEEGDLLVAEASANSDIRRSKIDRFRFFVSAKLDEVSRIVASVSDDGSSDDFHRKAIKKWWSLMQEFEMEPTRIDHALYATLDGKWEFEELSLENNFDDFED